MTIRVMLCGLLAVFLCACATHDITPGPCSDSGVRDDGQSWRINQVHAVSQDEINRVCDPAPDGYQPSGCYRFVFNDLNAMDLWWVVGDTCAEQHERSHARCGLHHTQQYDNDIANGHPRPACRG